MHRWWVKVAATLAVSAALAGCDDHLAKPRVSALHKIDWANVTLPGAVCAVGHPIHLHDHTAFLKERPRRWARAVRVDAGWARLAYGRLGRGGQDAAGLAVDCNNGGGTADGVLHYAWVIFTGR